MGETSPGSTLDPHKNKEPPGVCLETRNTHETDGVGGGRGLLWAGDSVWVRNEGEMTRTVSRSPNRRQPPDHRDSTARYWEGDGDGHWFEGRPGITVMLPVLVVLVLRPDSG